MHDNSNPEFWSDEKLEAHARTWCGLPTIQLKAVMTDEDCEAHSDLLYMRGMLDDLVTVKAELQREIRGVDPIPAEPLFRLKYLADNARHWTSMSLEFSEPWPADEAAALLDAWRGQDRAA